MFERSHELNETGFASEEYDRLLEDASALTDADARRYHLAYDDAITEIARLADGDVADNPVSPKDGLATMYHLLGVNPFQTLPDKTGRQIPLVPEETRVVEEALA